MARRIKIEPATSDRSTCHTCGESIQKGALRVHVVDDRQFRKYVDNHKGPLVGEGMTRGYIEEVEGKTIYIKKYYSHMACYQPLNKQPVSEEQFCLKGVGLDNKMEFYSWLREKNKNVSKLKTIGVRKTARQGNRNVQSSKLNTKMVKRGRKIKKIR